MTMMQMMKIRMAMMVATIILITVAFDIFIITTIELYLHHPLIILFLDICLVLSIY